MIRRSVRGLLAGLALAAPAHAQERFITVASTTSTEQSGLFGHILPIFTAKTGIEVRVVARPRCTDRVLRRFLMRTPSPFEVAKDDVRLAAALIEVDPKSGRAQSIEPLLLALP